MGADKFSFFPSVVACFTTIHPFVDESGCGESPAHKHRVPNPIVLVGSTTYGETVANDDDTHGTENAAFARFPRGLGRGKDRPRAPLVVKVTTGLWVGSGWRTWTCGHTHVACARRLKSMHGEAAAKMAALGRPRCRR
eukprot:scaffold1052_cov339-Pavlova_lutheri.AAC.19